MVCVCVCECGRKEDHEPVLRDDVVPERVEQSMWLAGCVLLDGGARGPPLALLEVAAHCFFVAGT